MLIHIVVVIVVVTTLYACMTCCYHFHFDMELCIISKHAVYQAVILHIAICTTKAFNMLLSLPY